MLIFHLPYQIPEDLQAVLNDSSFIKENSEVTTKEILKRYGDIARGSFSQKANNGGETFTITNSSRSANAPTSARIETDPSQDAAWQMQSSVRHVQSPVGGQSYNASSTPTDYAPPQPGALRERSASNGSQPNSIQSEGQGQQMPHRTRQGTGPMGVAG